MNKFFIVTHSPYILTCFNNLLQAGIVESKLKDNKEKLDKLYSIVPKEKIIRPGEIACYNLDYDGCRSIIDPETGLISVNPIDEVSEELSLQFGDLLDLEEF